MKIQPIKPILAERVSDSNLVDVHYADREARTLARLVSTDYGRIIADDRDTGISGTFTLQVSKVWPLDDVVNLLSGLDPII